MMSLMAFHKAMKKLYAGSKLLIYSSAQHQAENHIQQKMGILLKKCAQKGRLKFVGFGMLHIYTTSS